MEGKENIPGGGEGLGSECALSLLDAALGGWRGLAARWREEGPAQPGSPGVGRACGNDFIGKACNIFSPPVCGSWRKLEVVVISVALAAASSRAVSVGELGGAARAEPSGPALPGQPCPASAHLFFPLFAPSQTLLSSPRALWGLLFLSFFFNKDF